MADWLSSMQQTYEYYLVDPYTWKDVRPLTTVKSCTITRDLGAETLGSASMQITESIGECYVRVYLVTVQNGVKERHPLGTFLIQTPEVNFNGKVRDVTVDAYTPLIELKENQPDIGYHIPKGRNIVETACALTKTNMRGAVVDSSADIELEQNFIANTDDSWLVFIHDLLANANYQLYLDEMGRTLFSPVQKTSKLKPLWTYDDGNSSILYPEVSLSRDLYGVPNRVVVVYSNANGVHLQAKAENTNDNSPTSYSSRGRWITHRVVNPSALAGVPNQNQVDEYAKKLLDELSTVEYTVTYTHGYCGTRIGDCVRLNYSRAGLSNVKAKIVSQSIACSSGCAVTEKATFTTNLWG